jgi:hypothetical protein
MAGLARDRRLCYIVSLIREADMPKSITCEVKRQIGWRVMTIDEALLTREKAGRCIECHEPVQAHKTGTTGQAAHFEHKKSNPRCSLSGGR